VKHETINAGMTVRMNGKYRMEAVKADGTKRFLGEFKNLITNNGLNAVGSGLDIFSLCCVGTGSTTPAVTDTSLTTWLASTGATLSYSQSNSSSSPWYGIQTVTYQFAIGVATGNLTEVGIGNTKSSLFSHALIVDGTNTPTTVTVLSSEALNVTYELEYWSPASDVTGNVNISGTNYPYTIRASRANTTQWAPNINGGAIAVASNGTYPAASTLGTVTGSPSGSNGGPASTIANGTYSAGSYSCTTTLTWNLSTGNLTGGISAIELFYGLYNGWGSFQIGFSTPIPKTSSYVLTLNFTITWAVGT
jgi:hypothetical protein